MEFNNIFYHSISSQTECRGYIVCTVLMGLIFDLLDYKYIILYMLFTGWEVDTGNICSRGLKMTFCTFFSVGNHCSALTRCHVGKSKKSRISHRWVSKRTGAGKAI